MMLNSVLGEVSSANLGNVLIHEHLLSLTPGQGISPEAEKDYDDLRIQIATAALLRAKQSGISTVVDVSPHGVVGRDEQSKKVSLLSKIQKNTDVHILVGTGTYIDAFNPKWVLEVSVETLAERYVTDINVGISGTDVKAALIGEQATGLNVITSNEEKCLIAASHAQIKTGVPLMTHTTHGTMALEQIQILSRQGVDLSRVVIGHMDIQPDLDYVKRVLDSGVNIAFDTIGKERWDFFLSPQSRPAEEGSYQKEAYSVTDISRARKISELIDAGYIKQIFMSQDVTGAEMYLNPETHGKYGYSYLISEFSKLLERFDVGPEELDQLISKNPSMLLSGKE